MRWWNDSSPPRRRRGRRGFHSWTSTTSAATSRPTCSTPPRAGSVPPGGDVGRVARHAAAAERLKRAFRSLGNVGSACSYLQEWLPHVAQYNVRHGMTDFVGLGRMVLSYRAHDRQRREGPL